MYKSPILLILTCGLGLTLAKDAASPATDDPPVQVAKALPVTASPNGAATPAPKETPPADAAAATDDSPVALPALGHYARLWTDSLFTTRALPMPETPSGPIFTDNLSLSGTLEDHGKLTAILIDKTTSNVVMAYIGEDNEQGFRISKVAPGASPELMRIQLQKGNMAGWVSFSDATTDPMAASGAALGNPVAQGRIPNPPANANMRPSRAPAAVPVVPQALPYTPPPAEAAPVPVPETVPTLRGGMPAAAPSLPDDPPLPPP